MMFRKSYLRFPFLDFGKNTSNDTFPKLALAAAIFKPSSLILPNTLTDNFYKGVIALATHPFDVGDKIKIDKYDGVVKNINFWYLTLDRGKGYVFIPTPHVYNAVVEVSK